MDYDWDGDRKGGGQGGMRLAECLGVDAEEGAALAAAVGAAMVSLIGFAGAERFGSADERVELVARGLLGPPEAAKAILRSIAASYSTTASSPLAPVLSVSSGASAIPGFVPPVHSTPSFPCPPRGLSRGTVTPDSTAGWWPQDYDNNDNYINNNNNSNSNSGGGNNDQVGCNDNEKATATSISSCPNREDPLSPSALLEASSSFDPFHQTSSRSTRRRHRRQGRRLAKQLVYNAGAIFACGASLVKSWEAVDSWWTGCCVDATCGKSLLLCAVMVANLLWCAFALVKLFFTTLSASVSASASSSSSPPSSPSPSSLIGGSWGRVLQVHALHLFVGVKLSPPDLPPVVGLGIVALGSMLITAFHRGRLPRRSQVVLDSVNHLVLFSAYPLLSQVLLKAGFGRAYSCALAVFSLQIGSTYMMPSMERARTPSSSKSATKRVTG